jgi:predicted AAA+ superfamily ATPase
MKSRTLSAMLIQKSTSRFGRIMVLTGARQTGKTTMARLCFNDYKYITVEDPILRIEYSQLTASQWAEYYPLTVIDEVQKEPKIIESIKAVYDLYPNPKYILLGSSQLLLLQKVKESLAGRCIIMEIFPLTLPEMITQSWDQEVPLSIYQQLLISGKMPIIKPSIKLYDDYPKMESAFNHYVRFGGYPAIIDEDLSESERDEWLYGYVRTYLERDIRDLADFKSLEPFVKFQQQTSILTGQMVNFSSLAKESGIAAKTAQRFMHYLELSYQVILLQPWEKNPLKRLVKSPKIHYLDPGIQQTIIRKKGGLTGHEFESAIVAEIYKQTKNMDYSGIFYHLRTVDGREVDLIIETEKGFIVFEIKLSQHVNSTDARHLKGLELILNKPVLWAFVISNDPQVKELIDGVIAIPAALFLGGV